jgi:DNA repair photolyase
MTLEFQEYLTRKIINVHKHVDGGWFWDKYSAHPYIGCRHGCAFCYSRGGPYVGRRDPAQFDSLIRVKTNAAAQLRKEIARLAPDVISCGDWQEPAESKYCLSRSMLEVVHEFAFPLVVIERSPLLLRDLDLLQAIRERSWVGVLLSFSNVDPQLKPFFEPCSPGLQPRLKLMEQLAQSGILVGMSLMPILPLVGDDDAHLSDAIRAAKDHGASFVLGAGLTMAGAQAELTLAAYRQIDSALESRLRAFYHWAKGGVPAYGPSSAYSITLGKRVRELSEKFGLRDRFPRYIGSGPRAANRRIAEQLFLKLHDLELEQAPSARIWAYRNAAWLVDELPESIQEIHRAQGAAGLLSLPGIGQNIAADITLWLNEFAAIPLPVS